MVGLRTQEQEADEKLWLSDLDRIKKVSEFFRILNIVTWVAWSKSDKEILGLQNKIRGASSLSRLNSCIFLE